MSFTPNSFPKLIVVRPNVAIPNGVTVGGVTVAANSRLYNFTTTNPNCPPGSVGFYTPVSGSGNPIEITGSNVTNFSIIQPRDLSRDKSPLYTRKWEESKPINADCKTVKLRALATAQPAADTWRVDASAIPLRSSFNYRVQVTTRGDRSDLFNGLYNSPTVFGDYASPDFTLTTYTADQQRDLILQSLASNFNTNSSSTTGFTCALCINPAGTGTGGVTITAAAALAIGQKIVIGYTQTGMPIYLTVEADVKQSLVALAAAFPGSAEIQPYLLPGTTPAPAGVSVAGTLVGAAVTNLVFISIAFEQAYYDYKMSTQNNINVGLLKGFDQVTPTNIIRAREGFGLYRQLDIMWRNSESYNQTKRPKPYMSYHTEFPNELRPDATYDLFYIDHCAERYAQSGLPNKGLFTTVIAVVSFQDPTTPYFTGAANPQKTYIQNLLNAFNTNNSLGNPTLAI